MEFTYDLYASHWVLQLSVTYQTYCQWMWGYHTQRILFGFSPSAMTLFCHVDKKSLTFLRIPKSPALPIHAPKKLLPRLGSYLTSFSPFTCFYRLRHSLSSFLRFCDRFALFPRLSSHVSSLSLTSYLIIQK